MTLGEREISDPTQMGIFASHLAANDLSAVRDMLIDLRERGHVAKAADAAQQVDKVFGGGLEGDMASYDARATASELTARFGKLEQLMSSFEVRLSQLEPVIMALGRWAARSPTMPFTSPTSVNSLIIAFRTMFDPEAASGFEASLEL